MFLTLTHKEECFMHVSKTPKFQGEIIIGIFNVFANINIAFFDGCIWIPLLSMHQSFVEVRIITILI
jgi:hypothetical protein